MRASTFEFRFRFFLFAFIYSVGFAIRVRSYPNTVAESLAVLSGHPTRLGVQVFFALGAFIVLFASAIRTWATAYLQGEIVHDMAMHSDRIVADGPYRYVRNPLYLGTTLLSAGIGFLAPLPNWVFMVLATLFFNLRLIFREEGGLEAQQATDFLAFKAAVPRLIPALTPRLPASGKQPRWRQAFLAESFMWGFGVSLLIFAVALNTYALLIMMFAIMIGYAVLHILNSRRQRQSATILQ